MKRRSNRTKTSAGVIQAWLYVGDRASGAPRCSGGFIDSMLQSFDVWGGSSVLVVRRAIREAAVLHLGRGVKVHFHRVTYESYYDYLTQFLNET